MKYFKHLFFYYCIIVSYTCFGQNTSTVDSLKRTLITQDGLEKIETLDALVWRLRRRKPSLAIEYAQQSLKLSRKNKYYNEEAITLNRLGSIARYQKYFDKAEAYLLASLKIAKKHKIEHSIARAYNELGLLYKKQNKNVESVNYFLNAYDSYLINDDKDGAAKAAFNLGGVYKAFEAYTESLASYLKSLELRKEINDSIGLARTYRDLATLNKYIKNYKEMLSYSEYAHSIFKKRGKNKNAFDAKVSVGNAYYLLEQNKEAKKTYLEALQLVMPYKIEDASALYHSLATLYSNNKKSDSALYYYKKGIKILIRQENKRDLAFSYNNLGNLYTDVKDYQNALLYLNESLEIQKKLKDSSILDQTYTSLANYYEEVKNYKKAYLYKDSCAIIDQLINNKIKTSDRFEVAYLNEKRKLESVESAVLISEMESTQKSMLISGLIILFIITTVLFFFFFRSKKLKHEKKIAELAYQQHKIEVEFTKEKQQQELEELLQEQERKAISKMINGQEEERTRIAKDLHDRLGSMLSVVKMHYQSVEDNLEKIKKQTKSQYEKANELLDEACEAVREIAHDITSGTLTKFGLVPALKELKQKIEETKKLQIELVEYGLENRLNNKNEIQLYRIIQELLNNILKHAQASEVTVQLSKGDDKINIMVIDNGIGFEIAKVNIEESMGLRSVKSRVKEMDGEFTIDSGKGSGTTINIDIPV